MSDPMNMYAMVYDKQALGDILPKHNQRRNLVMKMKKRFFLAAVLSICILFSVSVNSANAAWYDQCTVNMTGSLDGSGYVNLVCTAPTLAVAWYPIGRNTTEANQGIAVSLTAISTGAKVGIDLVAGVIRCIAVRPAQ
jgi:hypothetical protein